MNENEVLRWVRALSPAGAAGFSLLVNVAMFVVAIAAGEAVRRAFRRAPVAEAPLPVSGREVALAGLCVLCNAVVMLAGWFIDRAGLLALRTSTSWARTLLDACFLLLQMDLAMYLSHRLAHWPPAFRLVHARHHDYVRVRPLTLFVLHPLEALGFGALWLGVLLVQSVSFEGMALYLVLNVVFGVIGHLGVEPLPASWRRLPLLRHLGTSTFHADHHAHPDGNFGFYTSLWDRLFRTSLQSPRVP